MFPDFLKESFKESKTSIKPPLQAPHYLRGHTPTQGRIYYLAANVLASTDSHLEVIDTHPIWFRKQNLNNSKPSDAIKQQDDKQDLINSRNTPYYFK